MSGILITAFVLAGIGAIFTLLNIYTSFIRYPLHKLLQPENKFKWKSGAPLFGSLFLWISGCIFYSAGLKIFSVAAGILSLFDTGGFHWFICVMIYQAFKTKKV